MRSLKRFWSLALVLAVTGFAVGSLAGHELTRESGKAVWKEIYASPAEMVRRADAVVLARMIDVRPGRIVWTANRKDALPFQVVEFEVLEGVKGASGAERIFVERVGGTAPDGRTVDSSYDGGAFEHGATYLLVLKKQETGPYFYQVSLQGRYLVDGGRLWAADPDDRVARLFEATAVTQGMDRLRAELRAGREPG